MSDNAKGFRPRSAFDRRSSSRRIALLAVVGLLNSCATGSPYPQSDHFNGERFFNPTAPGQDGGFFRVLRLLAHRHPQPWPKSVENLPTKRWLNPIPEGHVVVTFINHATVLLQFHGLNVLTDPVYSDRASPFSWIGPKRVRSPGVAFDDLPRIDLVVISHNHYDHLDVNTIRRLEARFHPLFLVPLGDAPLMRDAGATRLQEMDWWDSRQISSHGKVAFTPTQHFSARGLFDRDRTLWGSYYLNLDGVGVYFGGDSAYSVHFKEIRTRLGRPDLALLPIGAYEPRWFMRSVHMDPAEAVQAHQDLGAAHSIGIHFGTFQLTDESIDQPAIDLERADRQLLLDPEQFVALREGQPKMYSAIGRP
jgi:L-ascorbate metabolism protein UlaG (beta-lactamase superfamily)